MLDDTTVRIEARFIDVIIEVASNFIKLFKVEEHKKNRNISESLLYSVDEAKVTSMLLTKNIEISAKRCI